MFVITIKKFRCGRARTVFLCSVELGQDHCFETKWLGTCSCSGDELNHIIQETVAQQGAPLELRSPSPCSLYILIFIG